MIDKLSIPQLLVLGVLGLGTLALCAARLRSATMVVAAMAFFATLGVAQTWTKVPVRLFLQPLQAARSELYLACGVLLLGAGLFHVNALSARRISFAAVCSFFIAIYAGLIRIAAGNVASGFETFVFAATTLGPLMFIVPALLREKEDWARMLRWFGLAAALWVLFVAFQFTIDWRKLVEQTTFSRFHGLTNNPQNAGLYLSVTTVIVAFLFMTDPRPAWRLFWAPLAGVCAILLLWTGSRTGAALSLIGMSGILYARLGRAILFLPVGVFFAYILYSAILSSGVEVSFDRLTSKSDTRKEVWVAMLRTFAENPVLGLGTTDEAEASENSFLFGLASYGAGMGIFMLALVISSGISCLQLFRRRFSVTQDIRRTIDVILAFHAMYFAGTIFEGYLLSRVNQMLVFFMVFSSMASCLIRKIDEDRAIADQGYDDHEDAQPHDQHPDDHPYAHAY